MDLVAFYAGTEADYQGRRLEEMLGWDDEKLEAVHDFIQVLFPLRVPSGVNPHAPLLTDETVAAFGRDEKLRNNLRRAWERMLRFYGLEWQRGRVVRRVEFEERARVWLRKGNHNHLRITRILSALSILGLRAEAAGFLAALEEIVREWPTKVTPETVTYWRGALEAR